jgi:hypothetical protein
VAKEGKIYAVEVLNRHFRLFVPATLTGTMTKHVSSKWMFWDRMPRSCRSTRTSVPNN